jgi:hypothetical protein
MPGAAGPGAVGHGGIVAYGARSPARSAAEGHARTPLLRFHRLKTTIYLQSHTP